MELLKELNNTIFPTNLTRKLTINNETKAYPVYKININALYYNDQNDRIASYISQYKKENGDDALYTKSQDEYNQIIENFIISSNRPAIEKTANNIMLVGQLEPGVVLNDGRVIDGNRRFTCIRNINKKNPEFCYFEAVILDMDINDSKKMIKLLELAIQHGEEKKIDYNREELLIGIYQDIVETKLLTIEEYANSTKESITEIRRRVEASKVLAEYLEYIGMPKQFFIARKYQLVSLISDVLDLFKKCNSEEMVNNLKKIIYINQMMNAIGDERKFTKNISTLMANGQYSNYEADQLKLEEKILNRKNMANILKLEDLEKFVLDNDDLTFELKESMEKYLHSAKVTEVHNKPSQTITKTIVSLKDIDTNVVSKLTPIQKDKLVNQLTKLSSVISDISVAADGPKTFINNANDFELDTKLIENNVKKQFKIIPTNIDENIIFDTCNHIINSLIYTFDVRLCSKKEKNYTFYFVDENYQVVSNIVNLNLTNEFQKIKFEMLPKISNIKEISLVVKEGNDKEDEIRFLFNFKVELGFGGDFEF